MIQGKQLKELQKVEDNFNKLKKKNQQTEDKLFKSKEEND